MNLAFRYANQLYEYSFLDMLKEHMIIFACLIVGVVLLIIIFLMRDVRRSKREIKNKETARAELPSLGFQRVR